MNKKYEKLIIMALIISTIINNQVTYSADVLYSVCNSCCGQDALLVGRIVQIDSKESTMKVEIIRLISGKLKYQDNYVNIEFNSSEKIDVENEVLLSLEKKNPKKELYKIAYESGCYFVQCMDDKKIKLGKNIYSRDASDIDYFDICLQWYCNTGEILGEEDFSNSIKYYRWEDKKKELVYDQNTGIWYQDSFSSEFTAPDVIQEKKRDIYAAIIVFLLVSVPLFIYFRKKRFFCKHK